MKQLNQKYMIPEELIKEARKRYTEGCVVECLSDGLIYRIGKEYETSSLDCDLWIETDDESIKVYDCGKWADILNDDSKQEEEISDNVEQRVFETGSKRDSDKGKPRISDLKPYTRQRFGYHMALGAEKYGVGNFELGQPDDSSFSSIHRHLALLEQGDMSECHASAIIFGVQLILMNQERNGIKADHFYKLLTKNTK